MDTTPDTPTGSGLPTGRLLAEQVAAMAAAGVLGAASGMFGALLIAAALVFIEHAPVLPVAVWIALQAAAYICQAAIALAARRAQAAERDARRFTAVAFAEGVIWGASIVWFCATGSLEQELVVILIAGGIAGAIGLSFGSYLPAFRARFLPATLPYVVWSAGFAHGHGALHLVLALSVAAFIASNLQLARFFNANFLGVQRARFENIDLADALRVQKEAAEAATLAKSRFLAAASHDLRQPVHALSLFVGALAGSDLPPRAARLLGHIGGSVAAVDGLFAALLDLSRLDAGAVAPAPAVFAIGPMLERIRRDLAPEAEQKGLALRLHPSSVHVETDPVLLERILRNLAGNAVRYTDAGRVVIGCRRLAGAVSVQVWDTGRGIAESEQERIFDEFHQVHRPGLERGPGLGLGLAIVRRLTGLLGLKLALRSVPGRGSCFAMTLPLADAPAPAMEDIPAERRLGRILVVDDNPGVADAMAALLSRWGHGVTTAASAEAALASSGGQDLLICDYHLGRSTGVALIAAWRAQGRPVPALLITADTSAAVAEAAHAAGLTLMHKPVSAARLRRAVTRLLMPAVPA